MSINARGRNMVREGLHGSKGIVLIDALIAILIFSVGILGMVAMQSSAVSLSSDAQYRSEAAMLAGKIVGEMWSANPATLTTNFAGAAGTGGANYASWNTLVGDLPNGVGTIAFAAGNNVTVTVVWQQPSDTELHTYTSATQIAY